ncbi:LacI family transcriptional regulator [Agromyces rhizosphaerae]|uniref:LacI family transcriptional regulator n=1 Tax=Agromyces rhizosphaerae TaxID=88374 RepID=A0A9W6CQH3_9MICO|nr:LacI family DNA-binding transcriptional regulator [Agromyces rhizosphaerae]GLI26653.1 LacI family transcriptional regulator [Agromyces rhizosphaerae]
MATLSDVASKAGVSVSAVSRVLTNAPDARVSEQTRARIFDAAKELDYRPNFAARALKFARTNVIAVVVPDLTNAMFTEFMTGVEEEGNRRGYGVLLARAENLTTEPDAIPRLIGEGRVDGAIVQLGDASKVTDFGELFDGRLPVILVNSDHLDHPGSVLLEDAEGIRVAVRHLIELGHRRIGYLGGLADSDTARRRREGFVDEMRSAGIEPQAELMTTLGYQPRAGGEALLVVLDHDEPPTAVVVANVNAAIGALLEARRHGLRVPEDLSIVAMHDAWTAENTWPPLTTVRMPLRRLGESAMTAMFERITTGVATDLVVTDPAPELIVRESTAGPAR